MGVRNTPTRLVPFRRGSLKASRRRALVLLVAITTLLLSTAVMARAESLNVNLDQCANGVPRQTANCTWQNGDLNALNSQWREGDGVPFRVVFSGLTAGADHSVHINYDF